ncbi:MAG: ABC transporter ATP-binding protein [Sandaracinaceae bacterium]|nr:ABC transporter ATP-binding protein [Sandaracinaceae bacterium]
MGEPSFTPKVSPIIQIEGLEVSYGEGVVLEIPSLKVEKGVIGLLGPNGAGKSTFIKTLLALIPPLRGKVLVLGIDVTEDPIALRSRVGYMPEENAVLTYLSALDFLTLAGELAGIPRREAIGRAHEMLHHLGIGEVSHRSIASLSTGTRQKVMLAGALVASPELLLLDEPTSGLDPQGREEMLGLLALLPQKTQASVVISTHILSDVERICDQVIVLSQGQLRYAGPIDLLLARESQSVEVRVKGDPDKAAALLRRKGCEVERWGACLWVRLPEGKETKWLLRVIWESQIPLRHLAPLRKSLERSLLEKLR